MRRWLKTEGKVCLRGRIEGDNQKRLAKNRKKHVNLIFTCFLLYF